MLALLLAAHAPLAGAACAADLAGLRRISGDAGFPLLWRETGMEDGKPLQLAISERDGLLHLRFDKAGEGLWAEGRGEVCMSTGQLQARFEAGGLRPGPAAGWLLRRSLAGRAHIRLERPAPAELHVSTWGWRGRFAAHPH